MIEITVISCYITKKVQFNLTKYTFGYSKSSFWTQNWHITGRLL